jgi:serine/threonine protein kinase
LIQIFNAELLRDKSQAIRFRSLANFGNWFSFFSKLSSISQFHQIPGSFGRVRLARNKATNEFVALKMLKKAEILRLKQVDHIISENTILSNINHPFLVNLN